MHGFGGYVYWQNLTLLATLFPGDEVRIMLGKVYWSYPPCGFRALVLGCAILFSRIMFSVNLFHLGIR